MTDALTSQQSPRDIAVWTDESFPDDATTRNASPESQKKELLAYLRSITYLAHDTDIAIGSMNCPLLKNINSRDDGGGGGGGAGCLLGRPLKHSTAALQSLPISSMYGGGDRPCPDSMGLNHGHIADPRHAYIQSRTSTAITIYPLLVSRNITSVAQLRRIATSDVDHLRHVLCRDSAGAALLGALLARIHTDVVDPSVDSLEVQRASAAGSGCTVRADLHRNIAVAVDRRPDEHGLRWHRHHGKPKMVVVCKECAPATYEADIQPRVDQQALVCPRPPWEVAKRKREAAALAQHSNLLASTILQNNNASGGGGGGGDGFDGAAVIASSSSSSSKAKQQQQQHRLFEPKPVPSTGRVFVPKLSTLVHSLAPSNSLPEDCDVGGGVGGKKSVQMKVPTTLGEITAEDTYDPFKCRAAITFTLDEITVANRLIHAVKDVMLIQQERAADAEGRTAPSPDSVLVDQQTLVAAGTLAAAFGSLGVAPNAISVFQGAITRGRLGSVMGGSSGGGGGGNSASASRYGSVSGSMSRRRGTFSSFAAGATVRSTTASSPRDLGTTQASMASMGSLRARQRSIGGGGGGFGGGGGTARSRMAAAAAAASSSSGSGGGGGKRGVAISDLCQWIEQRLDAPKFLRSVFSRFSRSTPWIIFRHEMDDVIRSRMLGVELILQIMGDSDILPFERFCSEVSKGRLAVTFTAAFLADAIKFIAESGRGGGGGGGRRGTSFLGGRAISLRRSMSAMSSGSRGSAHS